MVGALAAATAAGLLAVATVVGWWWWSRSFALPSEAALTRSLVLIAPMVLLPLVGAVLLLRRQPLLATALLATQALLTLPAALSSVRLLAEAPSAAALGLTMMSIASYGALVTAAIVAVRLIDGWPRPSAPPALAVVAAVAALAPTILSPVTARLPDGQTLHIVGDLLLLIAGEPFAVAVTLLGPVTAAAVVALGITLRGRTGVMVIAAAAGTAWVFSVTRAVDAATDPTTVVTVAGWVGFAGETALLLLAVRWWSADDASHAPATGDHEAPVAAG